MAVSTAILRLAVCDIMNKAFIHGRSADYILSQPFSALQHGCALKN